MAMDQLYTDTLRELEQAKARIAELEAENANQKEVLGMIAESANWPEDVQTYIRVRSMIADCRRIEDLDLKIKARVAELMGTNRLRNGGSDSD